VSVQKYTKVGTLHLFLRLALKYVKIVLGSNREIHSCMKGLRGWS